MDKSSTYYEWHPESIGWLHRRHCNGDPIEPADVKRLAKADASFIKDEMMQHYAQLCLTGELKKRRGRPPRGISYQLRLSIAAELVVERTSKIRDARRRDGNNGGRGLVEPCVQAADEIGNELYLPRGRSLLNAISEWKSAQV
jgi:hypothetical protein